LAPMRRPRISSTKKTMSGPMNSSNKNPATETFDRLQRRTAIPLVLAVTTAALIANDASIWMFPVIFAAALVYVLSIIGGTRLIRALGARLRGRKRRDKDSH
jgi:hypothetical protein